MSRMSWTPGDWLCGACQHNNFKKREACQRCGYPKFGGSDPWSYREDQGLEALAGDWFCDVMNCGAHNYASRINCFRCGAGKAELMSPTAAVYASNAALPPGWKAGDWICSSFGCGVHNYASRVQCFKCKAPKDCGGA